MTALQLFKQADLGQMLGRAASTFSDVASKGMGAISNALPAGGAAASLPTPVPTPTLPGGAGGGIGGWLSDMGNKITGGAQDVSQKAQGLWNDPKLQEYLLPTGIGAGLGGLGGMMFGEEDEDGGGTFGNTVKGALMGAGAGAGGKYLYDQFSGPRRFGASAKENELREKYEPTPERLTYGEMTKKPGAQRAWWDFFTRQDPTTDMAAGGVIGAGNAMRNIRHGNQVARTALEGAQGSLKDNLARGQAGNIQARGNALVTNAVERGRGHLHNGASRQAFLNTVLSGGNAEHVGGGQSSAPGNPSGAQAVENMLGGNRGLTNRIIGEGANPNYLQVAPGTRGASALNTFGKLLPSKGTMRNVRNVGTGAIGGAAVTGLGAKGLKELGDWVHPVPPMVRQTWELNGYGDGN